MKERQIKIYGFDRDSISDGVISSEDLESRIIVVLQIKWYSNPHFIWNCIGWNFIYPFTLNEAVSSQ